MFSKIITFVVKYVPLTLLIAIFVAAQLLIVPEISNQTIVIILNALLMVPISYLIIFGKKYKYRDILALVSIYSTCIVAVLFALLFFINPHTADWLAVEDFIVEYATAIASLIGALVLLVLSFPMLKNKEVLQGIFAIILSLGFFIVAMEEISWGQRLFGIESNEYFAENNMQGEINLHNFDTNLTMLLFWIITFTFFVLLPLFKERTLKVLKKIKLESLGLFIPGRWLTLIYAIALGFTINLYLANIIMMVFTLMTLIYYLVALPDDLKKLKIPIVTTLLTVFVSLVLIHLVNYETLGVRSSATGEYKEFIICVAIMMYSIDVSFRYKSVPLKKPQHLKQDK